MRLNSWALWGSIGAAAVGVAVNLATEWKYNVVAWLAVLVLAVAVGWIASMAGESDKGGAAGRSKSGHPVLRWDEQYGTARRTVSTTSEKVATQFLKSVPPPLGSSSEPPSAKSGNL
ncbi:hypothetical protein GCM10020001_036410 [Nonomuraea salmonea]